VPRTHNNINPVPDVKPPLGIENFPGNVPPTLPPTTKPTPTYLLAPFGTSGTVAANPRAEQKLREESNGGPPDVHGTLRNARSESSQIGSHHELISATAASDSNSTSNLSAAAPAEGHNPDFDAKVRLLQQRLREVRK
jgi:hypothetical protein